MLADIRDILIVTTRKDKPLYQELLKNGDNFGCHLQFAVQEEAGGIAQAFSLAENFIAGDNVMLVLGDNIFYDGDIENTLPKIAAEFKDGALIFAKKVAQPQKYGIVEFSNDNVVSIEEKPEHPKSNWAIPGLYIYDQKVVEIAKGLRPSHRGELEITDVNSYYLQEGMLKCEKLHSEWYDAGDCDSLLVGANAVKAHLERTGINVGCIEEVAFQKGWVNKETLIKVASINKTSALTGVSEAAPLNGVVTFNHSVAKKAKPLPCR